MSSCATTAAPFGMALAAHQSAVPRACRRLRRQARANRTAAEKENEPSSAFLGGWLDLTSLVTSGASDERAEGLAESIGDDIYADFGGWRIFMKDFHRAHVGLAKAMRDALTEGKAPSKGTVEEVLARVPVSLGKGKAEVSLFDCVPEQLRLSTFPF